MATYRIHRLRAHLRQSFRYAPHVSGIAEVKPRDYLEVSATVDAATPYAAYFQLRDTPEALQVGDLLEVDGNVRILKFVGFEEARWVIPETKSATDGPSIPAAETTTSAALQ
jgi:hypothetical protein